MTDGREWLECIDEIAELRDKEKVNLQELLKYILFTPDTLGQCKVLMALIIKQSCLKGDILTKREMTNTIFELFQKDKIDEGKSAIYNRIAVIKYMIDNNSTAVMQLIRSGNSVNDKVIYTEVLKLTNHYKNFKSILNLTKPKPHKEIVNAIQENFNNHPTLEMVERRGKIIIRERQKTEVS